ncbi:hypothetical protein FH039_02275 [Thermococcus indicus]|uniref:Uncharacterized protein n=1 Tax=Thermococcus indicus TaxID=2586643 RepID=A0A4Y5SJW0_9EURY|nr:hypothetical protein [Thermococcus indicus]QDA30674.1 hypothetical protein FH039_02275 [Thermococcus indicus]
MRRGQLFSMDALLSLVLVIMILGTVSATSESLRSEINSLVSWYGRTNIADNMLDVLTKTPGEPEDWDENIQEMKYPGWREDNSHEVSCTKIRRFIELLEKGNQNEYNFLKNLSQNNNFYVNIYIPEPVIIVNFSGSGFCNITKDTFIDESTSLTCDPFQAYGDVTLYVKGNLCLLPGSLYVQSSSTAGFKLKVGYDPNTGELSTPYNIIISDSLKITPNSRGTVHIATTGNLIIKNSNLEYPLIENQAPGDVTYSIQLRGILYVNVDGTWYAAVSSSGADTYVAQAHWYKFIQDQWADASGDVNVASGTWIVYILGHPIAEGYKVSVAGTFEKLVNPSDFPTCQVVPTSISSVKVQIPTVGNFSKPTWNFSYINGKFSLGGKMNTKNASWVTNSRRIIVINTRVYNNTIPLIKNGTKLLDGSIKYPIQPSVNFEIEVNDTKGYAILVAVNGEESSAILISKSDNKLEVTVYSFDSSGDLRAVHTYTGESTVKVPWSDLFSKPSSIVQLWLYRTYFTNARIIDNGIKPYLEYRYIVGKVEIWIWPRG